MGIGSDGDERLAEEGLTPKVENVEGLGTELDVLVVLDDAGTGTVTKNGGYPDGRDVGMPVGKGWQWGAPVIALREFI